MRNWASRPSTLGGDTRVGMRSVAVEGQDAACEILEKHRLACFGSSSTPLTRWQQHDAVQDLGLSNVRRERLVAGCAAVHLTTLAWGVAFISSDTTLVSRTIICRA